MSKKPRGTHSVSDPDAAPLKAKAAKLRAAVRRVWKRKA